MPADIARHGTLADCPLGAVRGTRERKSRSPMIVDTGRIVYPGVASGTCRVRAPMSGGHPLGIAGTLGSSGDRDIS